MFGLLPISRYVTKLCPGVIVTSLDIKMVEPKKRAARSCESDISESSATQHDDASTAKVPRLFILCGRDRKVEELRELFATCGTIRHLQLATDRSNKSRGFAFLQYEDPWCASEAIKQFDQLTLADGHTLKVSVAREKGASAGGSTATHKPQPGKLKRNQHSQDEPNRGRDSESSVEGALPGKRQRSSPPTAALIATPLLHGWIRRAQAEEHQEIDDKPVLSAEEEIAQILKDIISKIERIGGDDVDTEKVGPPSAATGGPAKRKAPPTSSTGSIDGASPTKTLADSSHTNFHRAKHQKSERAVNTQASATRQPHHQFLMRQRRQTSVDESDSSIDDASDASVGRRKRSSTEPAGAEADTEATIQATTRRRLSDLSELSLSPAGISSPKAAAKKRCDRRPPPAQTSSFRPVDPISIPPFARSPARRRQHASRSTLFFTSTYKFTAQELDAMFSVYDDFRSIQPVKSFGRLKTMAYVRYATSNAATGVMAAFHEDNDSDDSIVMKLVYAEAEPTPPSVQFQPSHLRHRPLSAAGESTSSDVNSAVPRAPVLSVPPTDRCWVMVLYDRGLTNEAISSCVAGCDGMEFIDIKMIRSTGESQGVAFVKFQSEALAAAASLRLHSTEYPSGSRKFIQAIVIADPSLFSVPHNTHSTDTSRTGAELDVARANPTSQPEDIELGAVEARFAHLMSGTSDLHVHTLVPEQHHASEDYPRRPSLPAEAFMGYAPPPYIAPYGHFQFGQPLPYTASSPSHLHPHPYHMDPSHHPWEYEEMMSPWSNRVGGGSPMEPEYDEFTWDASHSQHPPSSGGFEASSVYISSSRPMELASLMKAIQDCPGVVGFTKEERDGIAFVVDFAEPVLAADAVAKLDGIMCNGHKLRVALASGARHPPSRRKRQRVDQRGRRR